MVYVDMFTFNFCVIFMKGVYVGVFEFYFWGILVVICLTKIMRLYDLSRPLVQIYLFVRLGKNLCSVCATQKMRLGNCLSHPIYSIKIVYHIIVVYGIPSVYGIPYTGTVRGIYNHKLAHIDSRERSW